METFGNRLKKLRQKKFITQEEFANALEKLGCNASTKSTISQYENNKRLPEIKALVIIAKYFDVSSDYLLGLEVLTDDEIEFMQNYKKLNEKSKIMVNAYTKALSDNMS